MVKISNARIDMESARVDNALLKDYGEILVGGATGANTGAAFTIDLSAGNAFNLILNAAAVDLNIINPGPSGSMSSFTVLLQQDTVGSRKVNWPNTVLWDSGVTPILTTTPSHLDIFSFMSADGGRKWFGFTAQQALPTLNLSTATLWAWGHNALGRLGTNDTNNKLLPVALGSDAWTWVASGAQDAFGIKTDGTLWAWGSNAGGVGGELGDNSAISRSSPIQIGSLTNWSKVSTGNYRSSAIKTDGTLWGWGQSGSASTVGLAGDNTAISRSSPVQIGTNTNWAALPVTTNNAQHTGAITTSGQLFVWGVNTSGQLGDNTVTTRSSPVQIGLLTNWASISMGSTGFTHAIKTDGTLWAWGINTSGQLGNNSVTSTSSPVQIGTLTNWAVVTTGNRSGHAVKTDGTLWSWGYNSAGQLGDNTLVSKSSPIQIGTLTNWSTVRAGMDFVVAIKTDGSLWSWGNSNAGQLGTGDMILRSSPVQIGQATTWTQIAAGSSNVVAIKT